MRVKTNTSLFLIVLSVCVIGWFGWKQYCLWFPPRNIPDIVYDAYRNAELEFLALSPVHPPSKPESEQFYGFDRLGSMKVTDRSVRLKMLRALDRAVGKNESEFARCYWPRHGIRCNYKGKQIDLIVCFECAPLAIYVDGTRIYGDDVSDAPKELFDQILQSEGLPINTPPW